MQNSLRILLSNLVDYAGLFPPSNIKMGEAVANFIRYQTHEAAWMLNRFVLPLDRIDEFDRALASLPVVVDSRHNSSRDVLHLSALGTGDLLADMRCATDFNTGRAANNGSTRCIIDALEIKTDTLEQIAGVKRFKRGEKGITPATDAERGDLLTQSAIEIYCEVPLDEKMDELVAAIGDSGAAAKIRTGGVTPDSIPSSEKVAHFIKLCTTHEVAFKATAGLHHPLRAEQRLTYEPDSMTATMHGFLNVFIAAAFAAEEIDEAALCDILDARDLSAFDFTDDAIRWRDRGIDLDRLRRIRELSAVSFGSCSFTEPVADLRALNLL